MLRSRKKDVNIKPNRKLDKRSSRGMLYENEELRLRTIEINAEVERGQCDLKKLRRENQRLRRDIWSLREEYERLEAEMARMRDGVEGVHEEGKTVVRRRFEDEDDDEEEDFDGDEEDEEEENAENLQKVNYYNSGKLPEESKAEERRSPEAGEAEVTVAVVAGGSRKWTGSVGVSMVYDSRTIAH
ncbi:hypothetical protein J437_LFUL012920 [Ladona fulva]|uniref:Uncharacterized protein n=1 Tax=Ladona fulva TaxID=123851 RepID=A0A8K0KCF2_LADFU|nr:hypothetical protein J437_LFUL012920 [Ladona fulva]